MKKIIILVALFFLLTKSVYAQEPNNKFGIHLAQPHFEDIAAAAKLVNSSGGDWGWVTLVIQEDDRKLDKWQDIFERMRRLHLVPIVRLATSPEGEVWRRPTKEEAESWANFLNSLNWVTKKRYVILFNEPNHGSEWGGAVDAAGYAQVALEFAKKLKEKSPDFFIMLAGLDASAPQSPPNFEDEQNFLREVLNFEIRNPKSETNSNLRNSNLENCFDFSASCFEFLIDGLASHSYPNPGFSGSPWDTGRGSVRTYQWEQQLLKGLGVDKDLPVLITETGWQRGDEQKVADYFQQAFENIWLPDNRILAVTPFILNYQSEPFLNFSWQKFQTAEFYQQYYTVKSLNKVKGMPEQIEKGLIDFNLPDNLVAQSSYVFNLRLKNSGQGYWDKNDGYQVLVAGDDNKSLNAIISDIKDLGPNDEKQLRFFIKTGDILGKQKVKFVLYKNNKEVLSSGSWQFDILPLPNLEYKVNLFPKFNDQGNDFEIQFFDKNEQLIFKKKNQSVYGGRGLLENIQNISIGQTYRVVILKPFYLPRQTFVTIKQTGTAARFKMLAPLDFDTDGRFSLNDIISLIKRPVLLRLFLP